MRWARAAFDEVIALPEDERLRTLADRCGDDRKLYDLVADLLRLAGEGTGDFLESPLEVPTSSEPLHTQPKSLRAPLLGSPSPAGSVPAPSVDAPSSRLGSQESSPHPSGQASSFRIGRYEILGELGRGGMGVVYRGRDDRLRRDVAIKVLPEHVTRDPLLLRRIEDEARLLAAMSHPNVATVYSLEDGDGRVFFTQELIEGQTLHDLRTARTLELGELLPIAVQIVRGVQAAHRAGIVHRDLTPRNIKVTADGEVKILDFGISVSSVEEEASTAAPTGGTPGYMSPEQIRGEAATSSQDVWAIGVCLFECLAGVLPFEGTTPDELLSNAVHGEPDWTRLPIVPDWIRSLLEGMLRKDATTRIDLEEVRSALEEESVRLRIDSAKRGLRPVGSERAGTRRQEVPGSDHPTNLPVPTSTFFGRTELIETVLASLARHRMVALTGMGGSGKTRLATEVGRRVLPVFPDGVWFLPVSGESEEAVLQDIAEALRLRDRTAEFQVEPLLERLEDAEVLLILDGWEATSLPDLSRLRRVLTHGTGLRVLLTTRRSLQLGEALVPVPPFELPGISEYEATDASPTDGARGGEDASGQAGSGSRSTRSSRLSARKPSALVRITQNEAVRLFVDRAQLASPSFRLTESSAPVVYQLVRRLDGLPLAIELAAARMRVLTASELLERLDDRFRLLRSSPSDSAGRRSLRAVLEWSLGQLHEPSRTLFRRLAVFRGGWSLEAAEDVCGFGDLEREDVLDHLGELVDHSLVHVAAGEDLSGAPEHMDEEPSPTRYVLLHSVREFAETMLEVSEDSGLLASRYVQHFEARAREANRRHGTAEQAKWHRMIDRERDNLWNALRCLVDGSNSGHSEPLRGLRLTASLGTYWLSSGRVREGRRYCEDALILVPRLADTNAPDVLETLGDVYRTLGNLTFYQADYGASLVYMEEAQRIYVQCGNDARVADVHRNLGWLWIRRGDFERAGREFATSLEIGERVSNLACIAGALSGLGSIQNDSDLALQYHERSLAYQRELGRADAVAGALMHIGNLALTIGNVRKARQCLEEALEIHRDLGNPLGMAWSYTNLGIVAYWERDYDGSRKYFEDTLALTEDLEAPFETAIALGNIGILLRKQRRFDEARPFVEESLALRRRHGDRHGIAEGQHSLGLLLLRCGHRRRSEPELLDALEIRRDIGDSPGVAASLEGLAALALETNALERAARFFGAAGALRDTIRAPLSPPEAEEVRADRQCLAEACEESGLPEAWLEERLRQGAEESLERILDLLDRRSAG